MFYVNDQYFTNDDLERMYETFDSLPYLHDCTNKRIAVCIEDVGQWIALCLYIRLKGGSAVPIHPATPKDGAIGIAMEANSNILLYQSVSNCLTLSDKRNDSEGCLIQFSSGTTGKPKVIERSWHSIEKELENYVDVLQADFHTRSIVACPVTHSYGLISGVFASLRRGAEPVIVTNMNPKYIFRKVEEIPNHLLYAAPPLLYSLSKMMPKGKKLHAVMTSGSLLPAAWLDRLQDVSDVVMQQYGCSEAGCVAIQRNIEKSAEMGMPLPHVKIIAGTEREPAEILIQTADKMIFTNDLGYLKDGVLHFVSRLDDMINVGGLNVFPHIVESVIMAEPRVIESVVFKKEDKLSGERPHALYLSNEDISENELREWCSKYLAPHQIPLSFKRVDAIDKLANGKISRRKLGVQLT